MVAVSDKFRQLATDNGRHVFCRIEAGGEVFLDDRILEFTLDDVVHPDWITVGTTCANRFHFSALFDGELATGTEVRPYVSFDNEEWCALGVFYISRRYVRGTKVSITAYDRMYSLDVPFSYEGALPVNSDVLLKAACDSVGVAYGDCGYGYAVEKLPAECTVRDLIGYIAGLNRSCAKIDRGGALVLKKVTGPDDLVTHISYKNCMEIQRNMTRSVVTCLKAQTETETLTAGDGAEISTIEMYNPLMTQDILDAMLSLLRQFSFYGADIEMQGLPYLESGESIMLLDGALTYPIFISEIELRYDGGLTATVYSRNKTYVDAAVYMDDLEEILRSLKLSHSVESHVYTNAEQLALSEQPLIITDFTFMCENDSFAELNLTLGLSQFTADFVSFRVYVNGNDAGRSIAQVPAAERSTLHLYHLAQSLKKGQNRIHITAQTGSGNAYILPAALHCGMVVHGGASVSSGDKNRIALHDIMDGVDITAISYGVG